MTEVIKANFKIENNNNISGVFDSESGSKKFSCWSPEFFHIEDHSNIYGKTHENKYISLLKCLGATSTHISQNAHSYSCEVYSHTLIVGIDKVNPETDKFDSISLVVGNPLKLFRLLNSFGYITSPDEHLVEALNAQKYSPTFDIEKHPIIAYFNGDFDIFEQETNLGTIKAHNLITSGSWGGPTGVKLENKVVISIYFSEGVTIDEAFKRASSVTLFLRFIGVKGLFFKDITLKKIDHKHPEFTILHDSYNWGEDIKDGYYSEPLIDVTNESFPEILKLWFEKSDREIVRYSFYNTYFRDVYSPDRLITAANMFDIFPISDQDKKLPIATDAEVLLISLKTHIKSKFSKFSDIKQSLLQSIGYLTRKSLKDRVKERLDIIKPHLVGHKIDIKDLEFIVNFAIKSRNYFVHGTEYKNLTPEKIFEFQSLFIDTFEYIYALSELVECGWKVTDAPIWTDRHRIRGCEQQIDFQIKKLREAIAL
jgi:hypothetical protein